MRAQSLSLVLSALGRSSSLLPDEEDREVILTASRIVAAMDKRISVVLVGELNPDPWMNELQELQDHWDTLRDSLASVQEHTDDILRNLRKHRNAERCVWCHQPAHPGECNGEDLPDRVTPEWSDESARIKAQNEAGS